MNCSCIWHLNCWSPLTDKFESLNELLVEFEEENHLLESELLTLQESNNGHLVLTARDDRLSGCFFRHVNNHWLTLSLVTNAVFIVCDYLPTLAVFFRHAILYNYCLQSFVLFLYRPVNLFCKHSLCVTKLKSNIVFILIIIRVINKLW